MRFSISAYFKTRLRVLILSVVRLFFAISPPRLGFAIVVAAEAVEIPQRGPLLRAFQRSAAKKLWQDRSVRFSGILPGRFRVHAAHILVEMRAFDEVIEIATDAGATAASMDLSFLLARALFETARFDEAGEVLSGWFRTSRARYRDEVLHFKGELALIAGREDEAAHCFKGAAIAGHHLAWPHQNMSAQYSGDRDLNKIDTAAGSSGRFYDEYNYVGQRVIHVGGGHLGVEMFGRALRAQNFLRADLPVPSPSLRKLLENLGIPLQELRVLPSEWFSQIGHQAGLLDMLFRMRQLGWWTGQAIMLPKPGHIANHIMLSLFEPEGPILLQGVDFDDEAGAELLSLQRYCGLSFNAFEKADGTVVPWQEATGQLMQQWETEGRGHPLRAAFDSRIGCLSAVGKAVDQIRREWGMRPEDWYVTLHLRDASHYGETAGFGQSHRNARFESYRAAIEHITRLGGWVIRLGGPESPGLPKMERVIEYAHSKFKSELMDLWLIRYSRFFVGTTSGLANVAVSFGVPSALVNCITTDAQPWNSGVRFALKPVTTVGKRELSQREITSTPWRWRMFSGETLLYHGAIASENSSDEILETVKEVAALSTGGSYSTESGISTRLIDKWKANLSIPHFYGAALPSLYYLEKHEAGFLCHATQIYEPPVATDIEVAQETAVPFSS
jgi:putative glycosyltransferase (TIGR04372 family)